MRGGELDRRRAAIPRKRGLTPSIEATKERG